MSDKKAKLVSERLWKILLSQSVVEAEADVGVVDDDGDGVGDNVFAVERSHLESFLVSS